MQRREEARSAVRIIPTSALIVSEDEVTELHSEHLEETLVRLEDEAW